MIPVVSILLCLGLPVFGLWRLSRGKMRRLWLIPAGSMLFCGTAMIQELYTVRRRLFAGDVGGIMDTIDAVLAICVVLLVVAVLLNLTFLALSYAMAAGEPSAPERPGPGEALP